MRGDVLVPRSLVVLTLCCTLIGCTLMGCARRTPPGVVLPGRVETAADRSLGRDRGDIEIALGAVTTAVAATLVVLGAVAAYKAAYVRSYCSANNWPPTELPNPEREETCTDPLGMDPFATATASSALSFALAVPIAAAGGVLLRKGVKMRRAYMQQQAIEKHQLSVRPWLGGVRAGAGLSLSIRF